jgi:hypothetical protein
MCSPEVWADARARLTVWAASQGVPLALPNEEAPESGPNAIPEPLSDLGEWLNWIAVEVSGDLSTAFEVGQGGVWEETGSIHLHIMTPKGAGLVSGLTLRKAACNLFRFAVPGEVVYRSAVLDPGGMDDDGKWHRLTARISYSFTDQ